MSSPRRTTTTAADDDPDVFSPSRGDAASSWESYDASNFPRERKRFDTTTPTLIDEEEEDLEFGNLNLSASSTGGATAEDVATGGGVNQMRRTPGATQMHQSVVQLPEKEGVQLGFQLAAQRGTSDSTSAAATSSSSSIWETSLPQHASAMVRDGSAGAVATSNTANASSSETEATLRSPLSRTPVASTPNTRSFLGSPWKTPSENSSRHGAFSPNLFRLTEDIGILLKEDEDDDDFTLEIPAVIRGEEDAHTGNEFEGDWTGSYVFEPSHKFTRRTVTRPGSTSKANARRRQQNQGHSSYFLPNAQQPKPRRNFNEPSLYFEGQRADDRASPQLLNFSSGAFVPPKQEDMAQGPFMYRPVASTPASSTFHPQYSSFDPQQQQQQQPFNAPGLGFSFQPPVFQSLQPSAAARYTPSPTLSTTSSTQQHPSGSIGSSQQQPQQGSRMQATAQVFVPRSNTPSFPTTASPSHWSSTTPTTYDRDWSASQGGNPPQHASPAFSYGPSFVYPGAMPTQHAFDARAAMTPSPLWPDTMLYPPTVGAAVAPAQPVNTPTPSMDPAASYPPAGFDSAGYAAQGAVPQLAVAQPPSQPPTPTAGAASTTSQTSSVDSKARNKEKRNRSRREKKKAKPEKTGSSPTATVSAAPGTPKKKSSSSTKSADAARPGSTEAIPDEVAASTSEDQGDAKRAELDESPATRLAFKNFYKAFRNEERESFQKGEGFAFKSLEDGSLPESIHYKVYLELADLAKRSNRYVEARRRYQKVCQLQPYASQGWLEYSKLEEECGFMNRVTNILHAGLEYCTYSESLLTRAVKHQERMGNLGSAREILARLKHVGIDKVWRTVLEGALLEARAGNSDMARRVLKYLMHHVPWYGPLYLEAYKLERDQGHPDDALQVVQRGLDALPRYGPLWFGAFRLYEEIDFAERQFNLPKTMMMIERAKLNVSKELVWKVHLEAAQMLERTALLHLRHTGQAHIAAMVPVRRRLVLTILTCPNNLRWKVWLAAGRMELAINNFDTARLLFRRAHLVVQQKSRSSTLLDCARLEEFIGETDLARAILCKARVDYGSDWKVWLESVLLEIRNAEYARALEIASRALRIHTGTGRLWATLVQLQHIIGNTAAQKSALQRALLSVPKSGEVWCEGGRIHLNPFSTTFDLDRARRCLYFAAKFTPQFGDTFVETLRVEILTQWLLPVAKYIWKRTKSTYLGPTGSGNLTKYIVDVSLAVAIARNKGGDGKQHLPQTQYREIVTAVRKKLRFENLRQSIDLTDIRLSCANADPNYGSLWFHCRKLPTDTPRRVIENAAELVAQDLFNHANIYLAAMLRRMAVITAMDVPFPGYEGIETSDPAVIAWETIIDTKLRDATSLTDMLNLVDPTTGLVLLESTNRGSTFVTGLVELSRPRLIKDLPLYERRRAVFGTDALLP